MADIFDRVASQQQPQQQPQQQASGDIFDRVADPKQSFEAFADQVKDFAREGVQAINIPGWIKGAADTLRATVIDPQTGQASISQPWNLAKGIAANNEQALERAKDAWQRGDYTAAALHAFNYAVPFGAQMDDSLTDAERGKIGSALGKALAFGTQMAAPESEIVRSAVSKLPAAVKTGALQANDKVRAAVDWAQQRGIPVDAGTATQNKFVQGIQAGADHSPIGSVIAEKSREATTEGLRRVAGELANEASPTAVTPQQAGANTAEIMRRDVNRLHSTADAAYDELREIAADPANVRNVQTGTKQVPMRDPKTGQEIPGKFTTEPVYEDVPLPVDMRPVKAALKPVYDDITHNLMPIAEQRASHGLLALENIINGPDAMSAVEADRNLSAIKAAARTEKPFRTVSQGIAARAVQDFHDAISEAVSNARRAEPGVVKYIQQGDKLIAIDANGDEVSQPAAGVTPNVPQQTNAPAGVSTPAEQLDNGADARTAQQGAAPAQPNPASPRDSRATVIIPGSPTKYGAQYEIRELDDIQPSHNGETFNPNTKYPLKNDRNYNNPINQRKVVEWSGPAFDPAYHITDNPDAVNGPPLIDSDGTVLGGNGRTMIMQRVYGSNPEGAAAYRNMLEQRAPQFGIDPNEVAKFNKPVLVRVLDDSELSSAAKRADAITDFNKTGTAALTAAEQAVADARRVSAGTLEKLSNRLAELGPDATTAQAIEGRAGVDILRELEQDGVISPQEAAKYRTEDSLTAAGKQRINQLLLGRFFRDADQLDSLPAAIKNKVERIAGPLARLEAEGDYALTDHVKSAIDLLERARKADQPFEDYLEQGGLFEKQKYSPEAQAIALGLRDGNPTEIAKVVNQYAEHARYAGEYQGPGMFGEFPEPKNPRQAFNHAFGTQLDERAAPPPPEPAAARQKPASFDMSFEATPEPPKKTAPPMGAQIGTPAGRDALDALNRGRAAVRKQYQTQGVLDSLPNSGDVGYQVYQAATQAKDSGIEQLRKLAKQAPGGIPQIARGFLEEMFDKATAEGDWRKAQGLFEKWSNLGPETKKLLFPNPMHRADLDKFFLAAKKLGEKANPSGTATTAAAIKGGTLIIAAPKIGIPYAIGGAALAKMLHSPAGVRALTEGINIPLQSTARATIAANRILRIAGDAARPANGDNVITFPGGSSQSGRSDQLPRAANQ